MKSKLISIVTVIKNEKEIVEKTIKSVLSQTYKDFEYIVVDGGSEDGSLDVLKRYKERITKLISERDRGISDAFNKGINNTSGKWLLFLNVGDQLIQNNVLEMIVPILKMNQTSDIVFGKINIVNKKGEVLKQIGDANYKKKMRWHMPFPHQATFHNRDLYRKYGMYDLSFKVAMDYELIIRNKDIKALFVPITITNMLTGGVSQTNYRRLFLECRRAHNMHYRDNKFKVIVKYGYMLWRVRFILLIRKLIKRQVT